MVQIKELSDSAGEVGIYLKTVCAAIRYNLLLAVPRPTGHVGPYRKVRLFMLHQAEFIMCWETHILKWAPCLDR